MNAIWHDLNAQSLGASDREATCRLGRSLLVTSLGALEDLCLKYSRAKLVITTRYSIAHACKNGKGCSSISPCLVRMQELNPDQVGGLTHQTGWPAATPAMAGLA